MASSKLGGSDIEVRCFLNRLATGMRPEER